MIKDGLLHVHTENSLRDSVLTIKDLVAFAKKANIPSIALTDHGTLTGIDEFMKACEKAGINGIPGCEAYVSEEILDKRLHLILMPMDEQGFFAISDATMEANKRITERGTSVYPRMNKEILERNFGKGSKGHGHVIATSACVGGVIAGLYFVNESKKEQVKKQEKFLVSYQQTKTAKEQNEAARDAEKLQMEAEKGFIIKAFKKEENRINKLKETNEAEYQKEWSQLEAIKNRSALAEAEVKRLRLSINAKSKRITELTTQLKKFPPIVEEIKTFTAEELKVEMEKEARWYQDLFGKENFYMEMQCHGIKAELITMPILAEIAKTNKIPLVAANDIHMLRKEDASARAFITSTRFHKYEELEETDKELYVKSDAALAEALTSVLSEKEIKEAMDNIGAITNRCHVVFTEAKHYPVFDPSKDSNALVRELALKGVSTRYTEEEWNEERKQRFEYEMGIIESMKVADYHLIVQDYVNFGRKLGYMPEERYDYLEANIRKMSYEEVMAYVEEDQTNVGFSIGPGRGSAAGSLVCFLLGITDIDPTSFGLLFERFLNPERVTMPDIDSDFGNGYRDTVIEYMYKRYGENAVCRIVTKSTYAAKAAIRECTKLFRTMGDKDEEEYKRLGNRLAGVIPSKPKEKIEYHMDEFEEIARNEHPEAYLIAKAAQKIEGTFVQYGMHAGGVVVSDNKRIADYTPLMWDSKKEFWKCQCDMVEIEEKGLLKMDVLGLRNLNVITDTLREIKKNTGIAIRVNEDIKEESIVIREICGTGKTNAVFQLESEGFKKMLKDLAPDSLADIILAVAMYRPGPRDFIPEVVAVKHGRKELLFDTPQLAPILTETYGAIAYQEQVQEIFKALAGYSFGQADLVRRAMSKKKEDVLLAERKSFIFGDKERNIKGCVANGITEEAASIIFEKMKDFAKYAFNKSHAAAYARVTYITAWLKYYYPVEYMTVVLRYTEFSKIRKFIQECRDMNIEVLPFDINVSEKDFTSKDKKILFGISSIKGVCEVGTIIAEREAHGSYISFADFMIRTRADKKVVEGLIKAGAFDKFSTNRAALMIAAESMAELIKKIKTIENKRSIKMTEGLNAEAEDMKIQKEEEAIRQLVIPIHTVEDQMKKLENEKEVIGLYLTAHPFDLYQPTKEAIRISDAVAGEKNYVQGIIAEAREVQTRKNKEDMAFFNLEDASGTISCVCFPKNYKKIRKFIQEGAAVILSGKIVEEEVESFRSEEEEEMGEGTVEKVLKLFVDTVEFSRRKEKQIIFEIPSIMDWEDSVRSSIREYIAEEGYRLLLHDRLFNEIRQTNLYVSPEFIKRFPNCFPVTE